MHCKTLLLQALPQRRRSVINKNVFADIYGIAGKAQCIRFTYGNAFGFRDAAGD